MSANIVGLKLPNLVRTKPYIDFRVTVRNLSVFTVKLTDLHGSIGYDSGPLSGDVYWVSNGIAKLPPGERANGVVRLSLDDPADVLRLRNVDGVFALDELKARIETEPPTESKDISLSCASLGVERIREQYPKLTINTQS